MRFCSRIVYSRHIRPNEGSERVRRRLVSGFRNRRDKTARDSRDAAVCTGVTIMKKLTRYSIGATLVAAALTLPQSVFAQQVRSNPLVYGAGTSQAPRGDRRAPIQSGVYIAPGVGVREVARQVEAYERSSWTPSTAENATDADTNGAKIEKLQRDYDANQERAKNRKTTRPLNVPATLGMLKDKPAGQRANATTQNAIQPRYLQYGPNLAPAQPASNVYVDSSATGGSATLNWDGSTNRDARYGRVQAPSHTVAKPAIVEPVVMTVDQTPIETSDPVADAPQVPSVAPFPELPEDPESSSLAEDVVNELQNAAISADDASVLETPETDAPALDESPATLDPNAATFVEPNFDSIDVAPIPETADDPATIDVPDYNATENLAPVPETTAVPEATPDVAPQPAPTAPEAAPATPATPEVPAPVYRQSYPTPKNVTPYAPRQDYLLMQPYCAPQAQPRPQAAAVPQTRGIPSQFAYPGQPSCAPQATCQVDQAPSCGASCGTYESCGAYGGYDAGASYEYAAAAGFQPGLIIGAEWFNWTTYTGIASGTILNPDGSSNRRDLDIENSGMRGRFGFRSVAGWDLIGTYTFFNQSVSDGFDASQFEPGAKIVNPRTGGSAGLDSVSSTLKVDLQAIDIELGRWSQVGMWDFRLFGGVRWTGLDQNLTDSATFAISPSEALDAEIALLDSAALFDEDGATAFSAAVAEGASQEVGFLTRSRMNAFGVRLGLETRVPLCYGLAIYGKGAGAISAGRIKSTLVGLNVGDLPNVYKKTELSPSVDASLGLSWRVNGLEARAGYEFNGWYNSGYVGGKKTDFLAHGFVAGLGYNY